jgi:hypothetical protein
MGWEEFDVTDKPGSDGAAWTGMGLTFGHC